MNKLEQIEQKVYEVVRRIKSGFKKAAELIGKGWQTASPVLDAIAYELEKAYRFLKRLALSTYGMITWKQAKNAAISSMLGSRPIFGSKGLYRWEHPNHLVVFNSRIFSRGILVWSGDLNLTESSDILSAIANQLNTTLSVRYESGKEDVMTFTPKGASLSEALKEYYGVDLRSLHAVEKNEFKYERSDDGIEGDKADFRTINVDISQFKGSVREELSPWTQFGLAIHKKATKKTGTQYPYGIYLQADDYEDMSKASFKFWKKMLKGMHPYVQSKNHNYDNFQYSASKLSESNTWAKRGKLYLKKQEE